MRISLGHIKIHRFASRNSHVDDINLVHSETDN